MKHYLLLGAGFSRNWGGWLSNEVFEYLLGCPEIIASPFLTQTLWEFQNKGFEQALGKLQSLKDSYPNELQYFEAVIIDMFGKMSESFMRNGRKSLDEKLGNLLLKFDAIFSLNVDTLLENFYAERPGVFQTNENKRGWSRGILPNIAKCGLRKQSGRFGIETCFPDDKKSLAIDANCQPYFKLHGSFNWQNGEQGQELLVIGANKENSINKFPILDLYHKEFSKNLDQPNVRLMIIGYSFGDMHINNVITNAITNSNIKTFIIDPSGIDVLKEPGQMTAQIPYENALEKVIKPSIIGASRRPFMDVFGDNRADHHLEYEKILRFFD